LLAEGSRPNACRPRQPQWGLTDEGELASRQRAEGVLRGLEAAALPSSPFRLLYGDWLEQWGWDAVGSLLTSAVAFDALVCGNDQIARGAIDRLLHEGVSVPGAVAVVGFDNWEALTRYGRHPITSIDMDLEELGSRAARYLSLGTEGVGLQLHGGHVVARWSTLGDS
jgi:LacI family transcriptional regulator